MNAKKGIMKNKSLNYVENAREICVKGVIWKEFVRSVLMRR